MYGSRLSIVLSTGAPAFTRRMILRGRISDSQNSLGYAVSQERSGYSMSAIDLVAEFFLLRALYANFHLPVRERCIKTLSGDRLDTATLNPFEAMFRARLLPITLRP